MKRLILSLALALAAISVNAVEETSLRQKIQNQGVSAYGCNYWLGTSPNPWSPGWMFATDEKQALAQCLNNVGAYMNYSDGRLYTSKGTPERITDAGTTSYTYLITNVQVFVIK